VELEYYFTPAKFDVELMFGSDADRKLGDGIVQFKKGGKEAIDSFDVAIIGVEESVKKKDSDSVKAAGAIRSKLYGLSCFVRELKIIDLGNINGKTIKDKYIALEEVVAHLVDNSVIPLVIGGSQDFTLPMADAMSSLKRDWSLSVIDSRIDYIDKAGKLNPQNFLKKLFSGNKQYINSVNLIGVQKYLYSSMQEQFVNDNYFNLLRLGEIKNEDLKRAEPYLRDTDILSIDVSAVKSSDLPAQAGAMPNGLFSHEICQLARYAGLSDRMKAFGLFELSPGSDSNSGSGAFLSAQMVWHFMEGVSTRHNDFPVRDIESYTIYIVQMEDYEVDIRFFNNPQNGRWWVEVPGEDENVVVSCCKQDYDEAIKNIIPEKWIISAKKSNSISGSKKNNFKDSD